MFTVGFLFWLLMLLWLVLGYLARPVASPGVAAPSYWRWYGPPLLVWVLLFLLGWREFGWPLKGG